MPYDVYVEGNVTFNMKYNMGESYTVGGKYGGVAYIGNTRKGYVTYSKLLEEKFIKRIISNSGKVGQAEALARADYKGTEYHSLVLTNNLIGCPEFEMWTNIPTYFTDTTIDESASGININTSVASTYIAVKGLFGNNSVSIKQGQSTTFSTLPQNYVVTLYKHDYIPYVLPIYLQNESVVVNAYILGSTFFLGETVNKIRPKGEITIKSGSKIILDATEEVTLDSGTSIELGAEFEVKTD